MDMEKLIAEIIRRIESAMEIKAEAETQTDNKALRENILIINRLHHQGCQITDSHKEIEKYYNVSYGINMDYRPDKKKYDYILVYDLDMEGMEKLTRGAFDTPYIKMIGRCLLSGENTYIIEDEMEHVLYKDTAPRSMMRMVKEKVDILESWGGHFLSEAEALAAIIPGNEKSFSKNSQTDNGELGGGAFLSKKALTQRDVEDAFKDGYKTVVVEKQTIITDIAKEFIEKNKINLVVK